MKKMLVTLLMLGTAVASQASVTIDAQAAYVYADTGSTLLGTGKLVAWVADVDGDGFGMWNTLGTTGFTVDADDVLLGIGSSGDAGEGLIWNTFVWNNVTSPNVQGKDYAMVWFNTDYVEGATGAGAAGVKFGVFETGEVVPNDGIMPDAYNYYTAEVGGTLANNTFHATYQSIPEPTTAVLALIGGGLAYVARRKQNIFA